MYISFETVAQGKQLSCGYYGPLALLNDYRADALRCLSEEEQNELRHACDYDGIVFYVDEKTEHVFTVDCITDDVIGDDAMEDFLSCSLKWAREQA